MYQNKTSIFFTGLALIFGAWMTYQARTWHLAYLDLKTQQRAEYEVGEQLTSAKFKYYRDSGCQAGMPPNVELRMLKNLLANWYQIHGLEVPVEVELLPYPPEQPIPTFKRIDLCED